MNKKKLKKKVKNFARSIIDVKKDASGKTYQLKHTPFKLVLNYKTIYKLKYGNIKTVPNRIVFDNYMGKGYGCNGKYITEELLKEPGKYDIIWLVSNVETMKDQFPEGVKLIKHRTKEANEAYASAKVWMCNYHMVHYINQYVVKKPDQVYLQTWHGSLGIKKIEADSSLFDEKKNWLELAKLNARITDYWISNSTFESNIYNSAFWGVDSIVTFGHARNDIMFRDPTPYEKKTKEYLNIDMADHFALYVPTHHDAQSKEVLMNLEKLDFEMLKEAFEKKFGGTWHIVLRPHPRDVKKYKELDENILFAGKYPDIQELLVSADAVITDYSSCIFDYMLTKKPGFLYAPDLEDYSTQRGLYYPLTDTPFPVAQTNAELKKAIEQFSLEEYEKGVQDFLHGKGCMEDGHAAERIKGLIDKVMFGDPQEN